MTTPQNTSPPTPRLITAGDRPVFPCWLWCPTLNTDGSGGWWHCLNGLMHRKAEVEYPSKYWHPDSPTAPTCRPDDITFKILSPGDPGYIKLSVSQSPAASAPELPDLRAAIEGALPREPHANHIVKWPYNHTEAVDSILTALAPLWPSTAKLEEELAQAKEVAANFEGQRDRAEATILAMLQESVPSAPTLAGAAKADYSGPTPETDAFMLLIDDSEIDLNQVRAKLSDMECERNHARDQLKQLTAPAAVGEGARGELLAVFAKHIRSYEESHGYMSEKELAETLVDASPPRPSAERTDGERLRQAELMVSKLSVQLSAVLTAVNFGTFTDRKELMAENVLTEAAQFIDSAIAAHSPASKGQGGSK